MPVFITINEHTVSLFDQVAEAVEEQLLGNIAEVAHTLDKFKAEGLTDEPVRINMRVRFDGNSVELIFTPVINGKGIEQAKRSIIVPKYNHDTVRFGAYATKLVKVSG